MPGAMKRQATLLLRCLGLHEPHVRPANGLADRLCVGGIILLPLHVGLHIGRRHEPDLVTKRLQFTRPVMGRGARFNADQARRQLLEERQHITALQLTAEDYIALRIDTVNLKNRLCDIEADCRNRLHNLAPPNRGRLNSTHIHGAHAPVEEPSTASIGDIALSATLGEEYATSTQPSASYCTPGGTDMKLPRRKFLHLAAGAVAVPTISRIAKAQSYPSRPVRVIVGFPAGNAPDIIARNMGHWLSERLGQQFVIENKPGFGSNIATELVVRSPPDGYTLLLPVSTNAVNASLYANLNFNFIRDIAPVASVANAPFVMVVTPSFPAKTVPEFIAYAKLNPSRINMASAGNGTAPHIFGELFMSLTGTYLVHVPYRGNYMPDLLAGQVQVVFSPIAQSLPLIREGKLRALGVTTAQRAAALPEVPAIGEFLKGYDGFGWYGLGAPAKTPPEIIKKLSDATNDALTSPVINERFSQLGVEPMPLNAAGFAKHIAQEVDKWTEVIKAQGVEVN